MVGGVGHTVGLTSPYPWRERYRAGISNTGEPSLPPKRAPLKELGLGEGPIKWVHYPNPTGTIGSASHPPVHTCTPGVLSVADFTLGS